MTKAVIHTAQAFVKNILAALGGMGVALVVFVIIAAVMAVVSTSFGIFFSTFDNTAGTKQVAQIVAETNYEFNQKIREIEKSVAYDSIVYHCLPDGGSELLITNWTDVVAVFSARVSGDKNHALDVVTMDEKREKLLKETFWDMNELTYRTEKIVRRHNGKKTVKIKLHITLTSKRCSDIYEFYDFTKYQKQSAEELLKPEYAQMLSELIGAMDVTGNHVEISDAALRDILNNLPEAVSETKGNRQNGIFPCRKGKLFLGRKIICYRLGQQMGYAEKSNRRRQQHNGNDDSLWLGLFWICGLGIQQYLRRCGRSWRRGQKPI